MAKKKALAKRKWKRYTEKREVMKMEQELKEILLSMQGQLKAISEDIVTMKDDIAELKEDTQVTREAVNTLLEWAEKAQVEVKIPLLKKAE